MKVQQVQLAVGHANAMSALRTDRQDGSSKTRTNNAKTPHQITKNQQPAYAETVFFRHIFVGPAAGTGLFSET